MSSITSVDTTSATPQDKYSSAPDFSPLSVDRDDRCCCLRLIYNLFQSCTTKPHTSTPEIDLGIVDLKRQKPCHFGDFRVPNETDPQQVKPHLDRMDTGWILSTGTERSLFNLILANTKCEGLIVHDINPKVKAYIDMVVLLLRICDTIEEFQRYVFATDQIGSEIRTKIENHLITPPEMKRYYLNNFDSLLNAYFNKAGAHYWANKPSQFLNVNYVQDRDLFAKLQRFARTGKIIATIGSIDDLSFLHKTNIHVAVADISNIGRFQNVSTISRQVSDRTIFIITTVLSNYSLHSAHPLITYYQSAVNNGPSQMWFQNMPKQPIDRDVYIHWFNACPPWSVS